MNTPTTSVQITSFSLSIDGLSITYYNEDHTSTLSFDPFATCDLLMELNAIEGFDHDRNGEPVVLFTTNYCGVPREGFALWYLFSKHFPFNKRQAEIILEHVEAKKRLDEINSSVDNLLNP